MTLTCTAAECCMSFHSGGAVQTCACAQDAVSDEAGLVVGLEESQRVEGAGERGHAAHASAWLSQICLLWRGAPGSGPDLISQHAHPKFKSGLTWLKELIKAHGSPDGRPFVLLNVHHRPHCQLVISTRRPSSTPRTPPLATADQPVHPATAMDIILRLADDYVLDKAWAYLVPVSAFAASVNSTVFKSASSLNSSYPLLSAVPTTSTWTHLISHLPHPPLADELLLSPAVSDMIPTSAWPRDYLPRQIISLATITFVGIHVMYFLFAGLAYQFIFNHDMMKHPRYLKNQVKLEIMCSLKAFPGMILLTLPWFVGEVRGYSKLYDNVDEYGWAYFFFSIIL